MTSGRNLTVDANLDSNVFLATVGQDATINNPINSGAVPLTINADNDISLSANLTTSNTSNSAIKLSAGTDIQGPVREVIFPLLVHPQFPWVAPDEQLFTLEVF